MVQALEREYQAELLAEKTRLTRIIVALAVPINLAFMGLDWWAAPSALGAVWTLRLVIFGALLALYALTSLHDFARWYAPASAAAFVIVGQSINAMILLARPDELAAQVYYGGLILVILVLHTMTHLRVGLAAALSSLFALTYLGVALTKRQPDGSVIPVQVVAHLFFFVGTAVIGAVAQAMRDRYSRENYVLRHTLRRDVVIKEEASRRAAFLAEHDPLTGLANRIRLEREAGERIRHADTSGGTVAVMFVDLDGFKSVNDLHGHAAGDRVLRTIADRLRRCTDSADVVARLGGDEFVVVLDADSPAAVAVAAQRIAAAISEPLELRGSALRLTASIGVSLYPFDGAEFEQLLRCADEHMYRVKHAGKGRVAFAHSLPDAAPPG